MIPLRLTLKNFLSYQSPPPLDLSQFKVACLTGPNGVGKSSLLEAITWALWGKTRADSADDLIYQSKNLCLVELVFQSEGRIFRVVRKRELKAKGGITSLIFQVSSQKQKNFFGQSREHWEELTGPTIKATQQDIVKILNLSYEIFTNSSYLRQGKADEFTLKPAQQRKEILSQILNLDHFKLYEEETRLKLKQIEQQLETLEFSLTDKKENIKNLQNQKTDWQKIEAQFQQIKKTVAIKQKRLTQSQEEFNLYEKLQADSQNFASNLQHLLWEEKSDQQELQDKKQRASQGPKLEKQLEKINFQPKQLEKLEQKQIQLLQAKDLKQQAKNKIEEIKVRKQELAQELGKFARLRLCPTCEQKVTPVHFQRLAQKKKQQFLQKYQPIYLQAQKTLAKLDKLEIILEKNQRLISEMKTNQDNYYQLKYQLENLKEIQQTIPHLEKKISLRQKNILSTQKEQKAIHARLIELKPQAEQYQIIQKEFNQLNHDYQELSHQMGVIAEQKNRLKILKEQIALVESQLKQAGQDKALLEQLTLVFSQRGVPAQIISQTIPVLETEANLILEKATAGKMKVVFKTKRAKKSAEGEIDTLDIIIADELGERPYELFSGGEAFRINFSVRVALSRLLAWRAGAKLKFLAIDEGFGSLDTAGQEDIIKAIKSVAQDFEKILVVSHVAEIKESFDQRIEVSKAEDGSRIEIFS